MAIEKSLLHPPGAVDAGRSRRRDQQDEADPALILVERRAKIRRIAKVDQRRGPGRPGGVCRRYDSRGRRLARQRAGKRDVRDREEETSTHDEKIVRQMPITLITRFLR